MNDILLSLGLAGVFFGAMAFRGIFGYLKNQKIALGDLKFSWKEFLGGSIRPILLTLAVGALVGLLLGFLKLVGISGVEVAGLDQITPQTLEIGLIIADIGAIGYAIKEALLCFGLTDKQIAQIREVVATTDSEHETGISVVVDEDGNVVASPETITKRTDKELLEEAGFGDGGEELEAGKGAKYVNTYIEPYRSAPKDTLIDPSTCYNRECVSYCAWKIKEAVGSWLKRTGSMNAKEWIHRLPENGYKKVSGPKAGGKYVGVTTAGVYGHVVWWEDGNVISEYNYSSVGNYGVRSINLNSYTWYEIKAPSTPAPTPTPTPTPSVGIKAGDSVIVNGQGTSDAYGGGRKTKTFNNQKMKVIMIVNGRYACNQYNKGTVGRASDVTGWWTKSQVSKA